ncbi:outer membrane beta-barrel protein [bacterium]|nr:outer membrane beta-barrel protein [bacterium]
MRTAACIALLLLSLPAFAQSQGMMRFYRMAYSVSGFYSNGGSNTDISQQVGKSGSEWDSEQIQLSTRNGYFAARSFLVGVELNWRQNSGELRPSPNPDAYRMESHERRLFIGPLFRWYQLLTHRWYLYPEVSVGYSHYYGETEESSRTLTQLPASTSARGVAVHAGAGIGYFMTRHLVFDASLRYMRAWRTGEYEVPALPDRDVTMDEYDIELLFGFQVMI